MPTAPTANADADSLNPFAARMKGPSGHMHACMHAYACARVHTHNCICFASQTPPHPTHATAKARSQRPNDALHASVDCGTPRPPWHQAWQRSQQLAHVEHQHQLLDHQIASKTLQNHSQAHVVGLCKPTLALSFPQREAPKTRRGHRGGDHLPAPFRGGERPLRPPRPPAGPRSWRDPPLPRSPPPLLSLGRLSLVTCGTGN